MIKRLPRQRLAMWLLLAIGMAIGFGLPATVLAQPPNCSLAQCEEFIPGNYRCTGIPNADQCKPLIEEIQKIKMCVGCAPLYTCIDTAVGCIYIHSAGALVTNIFKIGFYTGGGIAFLLMLFGAFQILTSAGEPRGIQAGKELITSAIIGLLVIIFSVFIYRLIAENILDLPGFGY